MIRLPFPLELLVVPLMVSISFTMLERLPYSAKCYLWARVIGWSGKANRKTKMNDGIKDEINNEINNGIKDEISDEINDEINDEMNNEINNEINDENKSLWLT